MNPLTKVKLINELNDREAQLGVKDTVSWHSVYKDSAWIFIGGFPYELTEGDLLCVFSQYGEIANINLVRDKKTGKSKGFAFICYEDQRSTILAVDNFNGIKIKGRTIRVDHVKDYRPPKDHEDIDDVTKRLREEGCAPQRPPSSSSESDEEEYAVVVKKQKKDKKEKKKKRKERNEKKERKALKEERRDGRTELPSDLVPRVKQEREDRGYEKYAHQGAAESRHAQDNQNSREREREWEVARGGQMGREEGGGEDQNGRRWGDKRSKREEREPIRERPQTGRETVRDREGDTCRGRDRERDTERGRDAERERYRERAKDRETDRGRDRERDGDRRRERETEGGRGRDKFSGHRDRSRERDHRRS